MCYGNSISLPSMTTYKYHPVWQVSVVASDLLLIGIISNISLVVAHCRSTLSMLKRRRAEFHGGGRFTRYRYPVKFHQPNSNASDTLGTQSCHAVSLLPASLRTTTRYGQEPTVQSRGQRRRVPGRDRPPRAKRMIDSACQCSLQVPTADSSCQAGSGATSFVNQAVDTGQRTTQDAVVMTTYVETISRMTETDVRLVDIPEIDYLASKLTVGVRVDQCSSS